MDASEFGSALRRCRVGWHCPEFGEWAKGKSFTEAYEQLPRLSWWLWLAHKAGLDTRQVVLALCACIRAEASKTPPAVGLVERWARGDGVSKDKAMQALASAEFGKGNGESDSMAIVRSHFPAEAVMAAFAKRAEATDG